MGLFDRARDAFVRIESIFVGRRRVRKRAAERMLRCLLLGGGGARIIEGSL